MSDSKSSGSTCSSTQTLTSSSTNSCCRCFVMLVRMMDSTGRQSLRRRRMNRAPQMHPITDAVSITYHVSDDNLFHNFLECVSNGLDFRRRNFLVYVYCYRTSNLLFSLPNVLFLIRVCRLIADAASSQARNAVYPNSDNNS